MRTYFFGENAVVDLFSKRKLDRMPRPMSPVWTVSKIRIKGVKPEAIIWSKNVSIYKKDDSVDSRVRQEYCDLSYPGARN